MDDAARLAELEAIIGPGKATFVAVGNALAEIRESRLYRVPAEQRADVWEATLEATDGKPTAAAVKRFADAPDLEAALEDFHSRNGGAPEIKGSTPAGRTKWVCHDVREMREQANSVLERVRSGIESSAKEEMRAEIAAIEDLLGKLKAELAA